MLLFITFLSLFYTVLQRPEPEVSQLRQLFFEARDNENKADELFDKVGKYEGTEAMLIAYKAGAYALKAKYSFNPVGKLNNIKKAQQIFSRAVQLDPQNLEIRFMRYAVESQTPSFLGYSEHVEEDKKQLFEGLSNYPRSGFTQETARIARDFLNDHCDCSPAEKQFVQELKL